MKTILVLTCLVAVSTAYSVQEDMLARHNKDRRRHGAADLVTDETLVEIAQVCEDRNAERNENAHDCSASKPYGENLGWSWSSEGSPDEQSAVEDGYTEWYKEIKDYDYNTGESTGGATGHFTQIVWKDSKQMGCAYAKNDDANGAFVACVYNPSGNYPGEHVNNVERPTGRSDK